MKKNNNNFEYWKYWLNSTTEFIFYKDLEGIYRGVSKATAILAGFKNTEEMVGKSDFEIYPKENAETFCAQDKFVINNKTDLTVEDWLVHPLYGKIMIETIKSLMYDDTGKIIGVQGVSRNVTEKHLLTEKVKEQKSQLAAILDNIPFALWIKDISGRYVMVNKEYEYFYNVKKENLVHKEIMKTLIENRLATKDTVELLIEADKNVIKNKAIVQNEVLMNIKEEERIINITKSPIFNENNEAIGLLGISWDSTEQKEYEKLLLKSKEIAEEANKAKSDFLANMSHEIRTPMNGILGFIQLLSDTKLDFEQKDFVNEVKKSSENLLALLNDILDLSKIEAGKMTMENISFNIRYVLEDVGTLASSNASTKGLEINVLCYSDVPEKVLGDPSRLKQVLNNFVNNAIKFTHEGEINLTAKLLEKTEEKIKLKFEIQDTGIGIAKEAQSKIFESFTQADTSTTRQYGGTGLGLTISKNIIRMMNGEIHVKSQENVGSTFSFSAEFDIDKNSELNFGYKKNSIKDVNILVIDDNKTNLKVVEHYLKEYNCQTTCAIDATKALNIIKKSTKPFDIILTDYCMPKINGIDFAMSVKNLKNYNNVPIILLSSRAQISDCKAIKNNNLSAYLAKPVRKNDLIDCIMLILNKQNKKDTDTQLVTSDTLREIRQEVKLKILLVEDNPMNQKLVSKMLSKLGFTCDIANNGKEAVKSFQTNLYDLIFMDCQMPIMDGFKSTQAIRELEAKTDTHVPIIALTANVMDQDIKKCYQAGMDDYLAKPIKQEFMIEKLATYCEQKSVNNENSQETNDITNLDFNDELSSIEDDICKDLGVDKSDAQELLKHFWKTTKEELTVLESNIKAGKFKETFEQAHSIKGASGNLRIKKIYELAKTIEMQGRNNNLTNALELLEQIRDYCKSLFENNT